MCESCEKRATHAFKLIVPSIGFPLALGSRCVHFFVGFVVCVQHAKPEFLPEEAKTQAYPVIGAAYERVNAFPDFKRIDVQVVSMLDPEWRSFVAFMQRQRQPIATPVAAND